MPLSKKPPLDLSPGSIIHIKGFSGNAGFAAKNKFLVVVGQHSTIVVLAFRITSQNVYATSYLARELVFVPANSHRCLPKDSYIQCFHEVERLDVAELQAGWANGSAITAGEIAHMLPKIREVVEVSDVLSPNDITDVLAAIDSAGV